MNRTLFAGGFLVVALVAGLLAPSSALAQGAARKLTVVAVTAPGTDASRIAAVRPLILKHLRLLDGVEFIDPAPGMAQPVQDELYRKVESMFASLNARDFASARQLGAEVEARLAASPASQDSVFLARFYKAYGCALAGAGLNAEGVARIKTSLFLFVNQKPEEYGYAPETSDAFLAARRDINEAEPGAVNLRTQPAGADVYVDGKYVGVTPLKVEPLGAGDHVARLALPGYVQKSAQLRVAAGMTVEEVQALEATAYQSVLATSLTDLGRARNPKAAEKPMSALRNTVGAEETVYVALGEEADSFSARGFQQNKAGKVFDIDERIEKGATLAENARNFVAFLTGAQIAQEEAVATLGAPAAAALPVPGATVGGGEDLIIDPNSPIFQGVEKKKEKKSIVTEWWFITGVAVLTAGAVTGVYFLTQSSGASSGMPTGSVRVNIAPY